MSAILDLVPEQLIDRHLDRSRLDRYFELLMAQNRLVNLVSRETSRSDFDRLVAESLLPFEYLPAANSGYLDIGSGGGIPAIPILLSGAVGGDSVLVERTVKKARALEKIIAGLQLPARVIPRNFEETADLPRFGLVTLRYVKLNERFLTRIMSLLRRDGKFVYYAAPVFDIRNYSPLIRQFRSPQDSTLKSFTILSKYTAG